MTVMGKEIGLRVQTASWDRFAEIVKADNRRTSDVLRSLIDAYVLSGGNIISTSLKCKTKN